MNREDLIDWYMSVCTALYYDGLVDFDNCEFHFSWADDIWNQMDIAAQEEATSYGAFWHWADENGIEKVFAEGEKA